jgi:uncharacterized spore protein YtfJ
VADANDVTAQVRAQIEQPTVAERLAQVIGREMRAKAIFGKPVSAGGLTVIPVAKARWGFGGGSGGDGAQQGSGGGGGAQMSPVGYIEVRESGAVFKPIRDTRPTAAGIAAAIAASAFVAARIFRRR